MNNIFKIIIAVVLTLITFCNLAIAQQNVVEPELKEKIEPRNLFEEGYRTGLGVNLFINDFGFGVGGQFRKGIDVYTEATLTLRIASLRDQSEQTFVGFFGQEEIPDKFNRVLVFPALFGVKHRLFPKQISDNFRVFSSASFGPALAFVYPYFNDIDESGFRTVDPANAFVEPINDFFSGWKDGFTEFGWNGQITLGIDFGDNFGKLSSLQFGYLFYYFKDGIQILEPNRLAVDQSGNLQIVEFNDKNHFFGTPHISFTFGGMW